MMERLKIALCITDLEVGGAERCLFELARRLDRRRFHPTIYCLSARPSQDHPSFVPELEEAGIKIRFLDARGTRDFFRVVRRLRRMLTADSPQLIQTLLFHANIIGRIAARKAGVRQVVSGVRVAERRHGWHLRADRLTAGMVDRHVCVSRSVAQFAAKHGRLPSEKLVVIPNGVDLTRFPAENAAEKPAVLASLGVASGRRAITYVGRLDRQKGLPWLIETAGVWLPSLPDCDLLLVGRGPLQQKLEQTCRRAGLSGRVHWACWRSNVPEIIAASDLLVLPSIWEGMPNAVLEAMATGRPVVATRAEGVEELLGPGAEEQTIRHGDSQALAETIVRIMEDPEIGGRLGRENRRRVEKNFTVDQMVNAYQNLWESLATA